MGRCYSKQASQDQRQGHCKRDCVAAPLPVLYGMQDDEAHEAISNLMDHLIQNHPPGAATDRALSNLRIHFAAYLLM
jgi:hypothetical protein